MRTTARWAATGLAAAAALLAGCSERNVSFRSDVQPILAANCRECHLPGKAGFQASGFDMTSYRTMMKGGKYGALIRPGDVLTSAFNMLVEGRVDPKIRMPHGRDKLPARDIETLKLWVAQGAKDN